MKDIALLGMGIVLTNPRKYKRLTYRPYGEGDYHTTDEEYKQSLGCWLECERGFKALIVSNTCGSEDAYAILYGKRLYFSYLICSYPPMPYLNKGD